MTEETTKKFVTVVTDYRYKDVLETYNEYLNEAREMHVYVANPQNKAGNDLLDGFTTYVISNQLLTPEEINTAVESEDDIKEARAEDDSVEQEVEEIREGLSGDIMPADLCDFVNLPQGSTYAEGLRALKVPA